MLSFEATQYAMKYAKSHESDKITIESNTFEGLLNLAQEEMGECIAAIGKYKRTLGQGLVTPVTEEEALEHVLEELCDAIASGLLLAEKMGWMDKLLDIHTEKSKRCVERILEQKEKDSMEAK